MQRVERNVRCHKGRNTNWVKRGSTWLGVSLSFLTVTENQSPKGHRDVSKPEGDSKSLRRTFKYLTEIWEGGCWGLVRKTKKHKV